jgi:hypothetical protein
LSDQANHDYSEIMVKSEFSDLDANILEAVVAPDEASLSSPIAKVFLGLSFRAKQRAEIDRLLDRNNAGTITSKQKTRLEAYVRVGNFLNLLKAKARTALSAKQRSQ